MKRIQLGALSAAVLGLSAMSAFAGPIIGGDILVYRVSSTTPLTSAATAVNVDEYTPAGVLRQTFAMPITATASGPRALTASGTASSEGELSFYNGQLALTGYNQTAGVAGVASSSTSGGSAVLRTIGVINSAGAVDTTTTTTAFTGNNIRGAVIDGTNIWASGNGSSSSGVVFTSLGGAGAGVKISGGATNNISNARSVNLVNGKLYVSSGIGSFIGVSTFGTAEPTTTQTTTLLPGMSTVASSPYQFFFADLSPSVAGVDTLYLADDSKGIQKWSLVAGTWTLNGTITSSLGFTGITGSTTGTQVNLTASQSGGMFTLVDTTGYNAAPSTGATTFVTAAANSAFRGVAYVPVMAALSSTAQHNATSSPTLTVNSSGPFGYNGVATPITPTPVGSIQIVDIGQESGTEVLMQLTGTTADINNAITLLTNLGTGSYTVITPSTAADTDATGLFGYYGWANVLLRFNSIPDNTYFNFDFSQNNVNVAELAAVPEPASIGLLAIGGLMLLARRVKH